jgi:hypothetical protein
MAKIIFEILDDLVVLRVEGGATFPQLCEAMEQYFPRVTKHLIWDYTEGNLANVTSADFNRVPELSKRFFTNRNGGRTAFACPNDFVYGMFRMYTAFADIKNMPYKYAVLRSFQDALRWVHESDPDTED